MTKNTIPKDDLETVTTMRSALEEIGFKSNVDVKKNGGISLRDIVWNYPLYVSKAFKFFIPFSYIFVFLVFGVLLTLFLESNIVANMFEKQRKQNTYTEGTIGAITSFNPLFLTNNYVDRAVEELVFDRFVYIDKDGNPVPGVASKWSVSDDRLHYEFTILDNKYWQNGEKLSIEDVIFTFETAISLKENYGYDSVGSSLVGMKIEKIDENRVSFKLSEVTPSFWEAISVAIVPKLRLESVDLSQLPFDMFAKYPIGSGKFKVVRTDQNAVYLEDNEYDNFSPSIKDVVFKIYPDIASLETAFRIGSLDGIGGWDKELFSFISEYSNVKEYTKREEFRVKSIFFNMRKDFLKNKDIRIAFSYLLDKDSMLELSKVNGISLKGPYSENSWAFNKGIEYYSYDTKKAEALLKKLGYVKNEESGYYESKNQEILTFTLSYFDSITNERLVGILVDLFSKEGIVLKTEKLNYNQITQEIIATRDFDLLLYEVESTVDPDQYNLWHSLKTNYPDLNLSGYSYERVDILLEDARKSFDRKMRKDKYLLFQKYLIADAPAIFLYNPTFVYFVKDNLVGLDIDHIKYSYERFHNIENWYWK
ncbi:MAG: ABC transporter substrate-binding protein [Candidatus Dojkabacteria bacterium]